MKGDRKKGARQGADDRTAGPVPALGKLPDDLLARSPDEGARLVALFLTTRTAEAHAALMTAQAGARTAELASAATGAGGATPAGILQEAGPDPEALHDFRVALRRLRVALKAFAPELEEGVPKSVRRRLRDLARATNPARDAEVQLAWLARQRSRLYSKQRPGAALLRAQLTARHRAAVEAATDAFGPRAGRTLSRLAQALPAYTRPARLVLPGDHPTELPTFAGTLAAQVRAGAITLGDALGSLAAVRAGANVGGAKAEAELAHEARLAAKRVRYLLAPVGKLVDGAPALLERLRQLQDEFGTLHDLDVLGETLEVALATANAASHAAPTDAVPSDAVPTDTVPTDTVPTHTVPTAGAGAARQVPANALPDAPSNGASARVPTGGRGEPDGASRDAAGGRSGVPDVRPGLQGLARRARAERDVLAVEIGGRWLDGGATALIQALEACAATLDAAHEAPPVEIERKYLLRALPRALRGATAAEVEQGYLPGERLRERVRRVARDGRERLFRTVKLGAGVARIEVEEETTRELFEVLWPATRAKRVRKRRYAIPEGELTWEVDEFTDRELVLAEVELPTADTAVVFPPWLAAYVVREVTDEPGYLNSELAKADEG